MQRWKTSLTIWSVVGVTALYIALFLLASYPLMVIDHPPLQDYANHLARMYVLQNDDNIFLNRYYQVEWRLIPNLLMDLIIPILNKVLTLQYAGKAYIILVFFLLTSGAVFLHWILYKKLSLIPLFSFLFIYNMALQKGFLNFLGGCGLAVWALAIWLWLRDKNPVLKVLVGTIMSGFLYIAHLHAFGVYAILVVVYEIASFDHNLQGVWKDKLVDTLVTLLQFIPWVLLLLSITIPNSGSDGYWAYGNYYRIFRKVQIGWIIFPSYQPVLDWFSTVLLVVGAALAFSKRWLRPHPRIAWGLIVLIMLALALPEVILGGANGDWRLLIPVAFIASGAVRPDDAQSSASGVTAIAAGILIFMVFLRIAFVASQWKITDQLYGDFVKIVHFCETGSRLFTAAADTIYASGSQSQSRFTIMHLPTLGVIERQLFVPTLAAYPMQQPISYKPNMLSVKRQAGFNIFFYNLNVKLPCEFILREFDYLLLINDEETSDNQACGLQRVSKSGVLTLYRKNQ